MNAVALEERLEVVLARLQQLKTSKPRAVKTLSSTIASLFQKKLQDEEITTLVEELEKQGYLVINDTKVIYNLPKG